MSCRFLISNTDHIIDVNQAANPHLHDQINIVCPSYVAGAPKQVDYQYPWRIILIIIISDRRETYNLQCEQRGVRHV